MDHLEEEIRDAVRRSGPITFARFMNMALYHPEFGYYNRATEKMGARGDFFTSPETHPAFGALIGRQMAQMWEVLDCPDEFTVVEMGAGNGSFCAQLLASVSQDLFFDHLRYVIVEKSPDLVSRQRQRLASLGLLDRGRINWFAPTDGTPLPEAVTGCFISNELPDAFPVHRVVVQDGRLQEIYVGIEGERFVDAIGKPSTPSLESYFGELGIELAEGAKAEVNLEALEWIRQMGQALASGFVVTIDYGFPAEELFSPKRGEGTLLCYYRHTLNSDPYVRVGEQDITTHVDFSSLIRAGREAGLRFVGLIAQSEFLSNLGIDAYLSALDELGLSPAAYYDNKFAIRRLVSPEALGKFKVLVQKKAVGDVELDCLNPCNDAKREMITRQRHFEVPLLEPRPM